MARLNRRRQPLGRSAVTPGSRRWGILMHGLDLIDSDDPAFQTEGEMRAAWIANREELMRAAEPGQRPAAFFVFELAIKPAPFRRYAALRVLLEHELINAAEARAIERSDRLLSDDAAVLYSSFETEEGGRRACGGHRPSAEFLRHIGEVLSAAEAWHAWRGRPELAAIFERRNTAVKEALAECVANR